MTTETTCLSSIWVTDDEVKHHYEIHNRPEDYKELRPGKVAYYDGMIRIDLSKQESMIALPFHPSNAYTIHELQANPEKILREVEADAKKRFGDKVEVDLVSKIKDGKVMADQGIIAGCSGGTYDNLAEAAPSSRTRALATTISPSRLIRSQCPCTWPPRATVLPKSCLRPALSSSLLSADRASVPATFLPTMV